MIRTAPLFVFFLLLSVLSVGCNGEDCTEKPTVKKHLDASLEMVEDVMDEADAFDRQIKKAKELTVSLNPDREVMLKEHESVRQKMIDELTAEKPNRKKFHWFIDELSLVWMTYTMKTLEVTMDTHTMFTDEQRQALADSVDEPPGKFKPFLLNQGIKFALFKIDATDAQKKMVFSLRDKLVKEVNKLYVRQHKIRQQLLALWRARELDRDKTKVLVRKAGAQITAFTHDFADGLFDVLDTLKSKQRTYTDKQVRRMERCVEAT